jgi:EAL domain-containing protein (putative c-di-GMP-specific phosphodiesterase class I)
MFISVNVSPSTIAAPELGDLLAVDPRRIVVELTEHLPIDDYPAILDHLGRLRAQGVRIAVDDAGSGYAGLAMLVRVAPDIIKLDRDLVSGITHDPCRRALASALVTFARDVGATLLAEGIENEGELDLLRGLGVAWGQGYHLGRPQPLAAARNRIDVPAPRAPADPVVALG